MNFDDIKERLTAFLKENWDRFQDSSLYNQAKDRFENLSPQLQKLVMVGAALLIALAILSVPYGYWSQAKTYVKGFEDRRDLVRRLLRVSREAADVPDIPVPPATEALKSDIESQLQQLQLLPEQIKSVEIGTGESSLVPQGMAQGGLTINLAKLNLKQIVEIGHKIKSLNPSVKMTAMNIGPSSQDPRYLDVIFKLVSLAVPQLAPPPPAEPEEPAKRPSFRRNSKNQNKNSESEAEKTTDE